MIREQTQTPWHLTRLLMLLCWFVWIVTFFITVTLFQAVLRVHVTAQVVQAVDRSFMSFQDDLMQFVPLNVKGKEKIDEMLLRYYLEMRYSMIPDLREMTRRWGDHGTVAYLSSGSAYRDFREPELYLKKIENLPPRVVDITHIERKTSHYQVDLDIYEYDGSRKWVKQSRSLSVGFAYSPARVHLGSSFSNPNGFIVTYVDARKATTQ